jgi:hypothetical protein
VITHFKINNPDNLGVLDLTATIKKLLPGMSCYITEKEDGICLCVAQLPPVPETLIAGKRAAAVDSSKLKEDEIKKLLGAYARP